MKKIHARENRMDDECPSIDEQLGGPMADRSFSVPAGLLSVCCGEGLEEVVDLILCCVGYPFGENAWSWKINIYWGTLSHWYIIYSIVFIGLSKDSHPASREVSANLNYKKQIWIPLMNWVHKIFHTAYYAFAIQESIYITKCLLGMGKFLPTYIEKKITRI